MATAKKTAVSFGVICPECFEAEITISLNELGVCDCVGCGAQFTPEEARDAMAEKAAKWARVARWMDQGRAMMAE